MTTIMSQMYAINHIVVVVVCVCVCVFLCLFLLLFFVCFLCVFVLGGGRWGVGLVVVVVGGVDVF